MNLLKKIISTPIIFVPASLLLAGFVMGKVNGILALLIVGLQLVFLLTKSGSKQLWK